MGIFSKALDILRYSEQTGITGSTLGGGLAPASPFPSGYQLAPVIAKDLGLPYGASASALDAYKVPSISKALALLTGSAANARVLDDESGDPLPGWINHTEDAITPGMRMAALVSDLVLHREAVWLVGRDGEEISAAFHLPRDVWQLNAAGQVTIQGKELPAENVIYFQSLRPLGLLTAAADSIEHYHDLVRTIRARGKNPIPMMEIHVTEDFNPEEHELKKVVEDWTAARQSENGAVAVTPPGIDLKPHSAPGSGEWLIEARNALRLDVANFTNLPAALLEGNSGASGTYENTLQNKDEYVSLSLAEWITPIEQRLSQPDVFGRRVRMDLSALTVVDPRGNTGQAVETQPGREIVA